MPTIDAAEFKRGLDSLLAEAAGDPAATWSWFTNGGSKEGLAPTLARLDARSAFAPCPPLTRSAAEHVAHLVYSLDLFARALRGENAYATADWEESWKPPTPGEAGWSELQERLRTRLDDARTALAEREDWHDFMILTGSMGNIAHVAYHLAQLRLLLKLHGRA